MRTLLVFAFVAVAAAMSHAAPWSFELPEGFTEQPGAAEAELARLRAVPRTVSADAQVYMSPDGSVRLTRMTWLSRFDVAPTRGALESMERDVAAGNAKVANREVSRNAQLVGDQLVADQLLEMERMRVDMRRIYAADTDSVVHMYTIVCAGPADRLIDCERAQQSMQLALPNQVSLSGAPREEPGFGLVHVIALICGALVLIVAIVWLVRRSRNR